MDVRKKFEDRFVKTIDKNLFEKYTCVLMEGTAYESTYTIRKFFDYFIVEYSTVSGAKNVLFNQEDSNKTIGDMIQLCKSHLESVDDL